MSKMIMLCAVLLAVVFVGCSYNMGERQIVVDRVFESEPKLLLDDATDLLARKNTVALAVRLSYGPDAVYRESLQPVREIVPYNFGREMGNFGSGLVSTILIPISLPVFALSGMPASDYWHHLAITGHSLNFFQANPDDPAVAFPSPVERRPIGEPVQSEPKTLGQTCITPLVNGAIGVDISANGRTVSLNAATDAMGTFTLDLGEMADKLALPAGENDVEMTITVHRGNASAKIKLTAHVQR